MKIYLPWLGEFGSEILKYVPIVYKDKEEKIVCCEAGKGCLYPTATQRYEIPKVEEAVRACAGSLNQYELWDDVKTQYGSDYEYIEPTMQVEVGSDWFVPITKFYDFKADIVVFPRWRHTGKRKNWEGWPDLVDSLNAEGYSLFSAGASDMGYKIDCRQAGDYDNELEASIWAIKHSRIRIGINSALTVLSLMCGMKPWLILTEQGKQCFPGNSNDYVNWRYYEAIDHLKVGWKVVPYMTEPRKIVREINEFFAS